MEILKKFICLTISLAAFNSLIIFASDSTIKCTTGSALGNSYTYYTLSDYVNFKITNEAFEEKSIMIDLREVNNGISDDFRIAVNELSLAASYLYEYQIKAELAKLMSRVLAGFGLAAVMTSYELYELNEKVEKYVFEVDEQLQIIESAYSFLYKYRIKENNSCVEVDSQLVCP